MTAFDALAGAPAVDMLARTTWSKRTELARVVVRGGRARVWVARGRSVELRDETDVTAVRREGRAVVVETAAGEEWRLVAAGCGCGSLLKSFRPPA